MKKILIIDDDADILKVTQRLLHRGGFEVDIAQDGEEGLSLFNQKKFDCVITDMIMPKKEGVEVIVEIKKKDPKVKIIALTGGGHISSDFYIKAAKQFHVDLALSKPFDPKELLAKVKEIL